MITRTLRFELRPKPRPPIKSLGKAQTPLIYSFDKTDTKKKKTSQESMTRDQDPLRTNTTL